MANNKITDRYDNCRLFLSSLMLKQKTDLSDMENTHKMYEIMDSILEKKSKDNVIPEEEYEKLRQLDCPHVSFLSLFVGDAIIEPDGILFPEEDALLANCPHMKCTECWKKYIDELSELVNNSSLCLKLPPEDNRW